MCAGRRLRLAFTSRSVFVLTFRPVGLCSGRAGNNDAWTEAAASESHAMYATCVFWMLYLLYLGHLTWISYPSTADIA